MLWAIVSHTVSTLEVWWGNGGRGDSAPLGERLFSWRDEDEDAAGRIYAINA